MVHPRIDDGRRVIEVHPDAVPHWKRAGWQEYNGPAPLTPGEELAKEAAELTKARSQRKGK